MSTKSSGLAILIAIVVVIVLAQVLLAPTQPPPPLKTRAGQRTQSSPTKPETLQQPIQPKAGRPSKKSKTLKVEEKKSQIVQTDKPRAKVTGAVFAPDGSLLEKARVYCTFITRQNGEIVPDYDKSQRVKTTEGGRYKFSLEAGEYRVSAIHPGAFRSSKDQFITVEDGQELSIDITMREYLTLSIQVSDEQKQPIQGATLWLQPKGMPGSLRGPELVSDAQGRVVFKKLSDAQHNLLITHPRFASRSVKINLKDPYLQFEREFTLKKGLTLSGVVISAKTKRPPKKARLSLQRDDDSTFFFQYECDPDGLFQFKSLSPGRYELIVGADGFANKTMMIKIPKDSGSIQLGNVVIAPLFKLTVTVTNEEGQALEGVDLRRLDFGLCPLSELKDAADSGVDNSFTLKFADGGVSDKKGQVVFQEFAPGTHNFLVQTKGKAPCFIDRQILKGDKTRITLVYSRRSAKLSGSFLDKNGEKKANRVIVLLRQGLMFPLKSMKTNRDGQFLFDQLAPGRYKLVDALTVSQQTLESKDDWLQLEDSGHVEQNVLEEDR